MREILIGKLYEYIRENNPDLLFQLEEECKISEYLFTKIRSINSELLEFDRDHPAYITESACLEVLIQDLLPSKFNYISSILEEEFEDRYQQLLDSGILKYEVMNLISACNPVFEEWDFCKANEDDVFVRYLITCTISEYFQK